MNSKTSEDERNKQAFFDSLFVLRENSTAMERDGNSMNDGRTVGDRSKKNRCDNAHTKKTSGGATNVGESSGRRKSKVGAREEYGDESKVMSTEKSTRANKQWSGKRKGDGSTGERRSKYICYSKQWGIEQGGEDRRINAG